MADSKERREYFRIKNWIILNHQAVDSVEKESEPGETEGASQLALLQQLSKLAGQGKSYLQSLNDKQSQLGDYLINLDKKVDLLTQFAIQSLNRNQQSLTEVDISGGGLRYKATEAYPVDQLIKIELVLTPECVAIAAHARVVDCTPLENTSFYDVALTFIELSEADRDAIIKHVFSLQSKLLRNKTPES